MFRPKELIGLGVVSGALYFMLRNDLVRLWNYQRDEAAGALDAINPVNEGNVFNRAANRLWQAISGSDETIGADIFDGVQKVKALVSPPADNPGDAADDARQPGAEYIDSWQHQQERGYFG